MFSVKDTETGEIIQLFDDLGEGLDEVCLGLTVGEPCIIEYSRGIN